MDMDSGHWHLVILTVPALSITLQAPGIVGSWDGAVAEFEDFDDDDDDYGESDNDAGPCGARHRVHAGI